MNRTFTTTYDPSDNKLRLRSLHRLDAETYVRVRAAGFIHAPKQDLFVAPAWTPEREDLLLEMCGEIGVEDSSLVDRAEVRAERFEGYSERREDEAEAARQAVAALTDHIPLGQPILVGHHSERRARRDAERIENGMRKAVRLWETSKYWTDRAAGAIRHAKYKERADVRARRIKTIEADRRRAERARAYSIAARKLWESAPTAKGTRADGTPADFRDRALYLANHDRIAGFGLWSGLDKGEIRPEAAQASAVASHAAFVARSERLIQHCGHRLAYERALLAESGWTPPPKPKTKADLPLLNYPGTVKARSRWHAGQIDTYETHPMTKAEYAAIHTDYRGTAVSERGTHRVRTALITNPGGGRGLTAVYLTDSKAHERPTVEAQAERRRGGRRAQCAHGRQAGRRPGPGRRARSRRSRPRRAGRRSCAVRGDEGGPPSGRCSGERSAALPDAHAACCAHGPARAIASRRSSSRAERRDRQHRSGRHRRGRQRRGHARRDHGRGDQRAPGGCSRCDHRRGGRARRLPYQDGGGPERPIRSNPHEPAVRAGDCRLTESVDSSTNRPRTGIRKGLRGGAAPGKSRSRRKRQLRANTEGVR